MSSISEVEVRLDDLALFVALLPAVLLSRTVLNRRLAPVSKPLRFELSDEGGESNGEPGTDGTSRASRPGSLGRIVLEEPVVDIVEND